VTVRLLCAQVHESGALVVSAMLDFLTFALCAPYSETTDGGQFDMLLEMVAANGRIIFKLFQVTLFPFSGRINRALLLSYLYV
jgi:hypothetical protein